MGFRTDVCSKREGVTQDATAIQAAIAKHDTVQHGLRVRPTHGAVGDITYT